MLLPLGLVVPRHSLLRQLRDLESFVCFLLHDDVVPLFHGDVVEGVDEGLEVGFIHQQLAVGPTKGFDGSLVKDIKS